MSTRALLAVVICLFTALPALAQRLPTTVVPEHYTLWFAPDLQKETFRGRETIQVQLKAPANEITLHAAEIAFVTTTVTAGGRTQPATVTLDEKTETATLRVPQTIPAGAASIQITYNGILNDKLRGFYISKANNRSYAVTQMEATDARRAFPSFDEPAYKATFDVSLMIDAADTAIANGRQLSDTPGPEPGKHTLTFARTPRMSTYLVAMLVGDFVCREGKADGTVIRICSTPDKLALTGFALEAAQQQLAFYNRYFGIPYPFGKLDIVAVPDFAAGAMENAGAITFRERLLLADPERASLNVRKNIASVISHEIAHQWFGNLVTMKWWDDIWLNEGFATWMANKPIEEFRPEWNVRLDDTADTLGALGIDALRSTRAIRTRAETPAEINELFDGIAYEKTAGVLRMIEAYVGRDDMRRAIQSYLKKYSYANAAGEDFWTEVSRVTGKPIDRIMKSYVDQPGAPVLSVQTKCTGGSSDISVTQKRFSASTDTVAPTAQTWTLPACFKTGNGAPRCEIVDEPAETFKAPGCNNVFANAEARGYYFTEYTPEAVRALAGSVRGLTPAERMNLLGDEWWMVRAARHGIDVYLDLATSLATDETAAVVETLAARLAYTGSNIANPDERDRYQAWVRRTFGPPLAAMGLPGDRGDDDLKQSRRAALLALVGATGNDPQVQRQARELAQKYLADPASLPPTLVTAVLQVAALAGDQALYEQYLAQVQKLSGQPEEYYRFFNALTWFRDPALVKRTLEFAMSPAVRTQDLSVLIGGLMGRGTAQDEAWAFTKRNWRALTDKLGTFQGIPNLVASLASFCSQEAAADVRQFFAANPVASSERAIQQSIESIESCAAVDAKQSDAFSRWLASK